MVSCGCVLVFLMARQRLPCSRGTARRGPRAGLVQAMEHPQATDRQGLERHRVAGLLLGRVLRQRCGFSTAQIGVSIAAFGVGLAVGNLAAGYLQRYLKRDEDMLLLVLALLVLSMSTFMLLPLPLPVALCCLGAWAPR